MIVGYRVATKLQQIRDTTGFDPLSRTFLVLSLRDSVAVVERDGA